MAKRSDKKKPWNIYKSEAKVVIYKENKKCSVRNEMFKMTFWELFSIMFEEIPNFHIARARVPKNDVDIVGCVLKSEIIHSRLAAKKSPHLQLPKNCCVFSIYRRNRQLSQRVPQKDNVVKNFKFVRSAWIIQIDSRMKKEKFPPRKYNQHFFSPLTMITSPSWLRVRFSGSSCTSSMSVARVENRFLPCATTAAMLTSRRSFVHEMLHIVSRVV